MRFFLLTFSALLAGAAATESLTSSLCFVEEGDTEPLSDCQCDASCATCGYNVQPTSDQDCITCYEGGVITAVYTDGTGTCTYSEEMMQNTMTPSFSKCATDCMESSGYSGDVTKCDEVNAFAECVTAGQGEGDDDCTSHEQLMVQSMVLGGQCLEKPECMTNCIDSEDVDWDAVLEAVDEELDGQDSKPICDKLSALGDCVADSCSGSKKDDAEAYISTYGFLLSCEWATDCIMECLPGPHSEMASWDCADWEGINECVGSDCGAAAGIAQTSVAGYFAQSLATNTDLASCELKIGAKREGDDALDGTAAKSGTAAVVAAVAGIVAVFAAL